MRRAGAGFAVVVVAAIAIGLLLAGGDRRAIVQTTGVIITAPVASLNPNEQACQRPLITLDEISAIQFYPAERVQPSRLAVEALDADSGELLGRGVAPRAAGETTVSFSPHIPGDRRVAFCFENRGPGGVDIYGDDGSTSQCVLNPGSIPCVFRLPHPVSSVSGVFVNGRPASGTMSFRLFRPRAEPVLGSVGEIFERASSFRPGFVGPVLWWIVLVAVGIGAPLVLWWALAAREQDGS